MDESNTLLGREMKTVVKNQIRQNDPPETKQTYDRLIKEGFPEEEVMRKLALVVAAEVYDIMKSNKPFNHKRFIKRLNDLPQEPELMEGITSRSTLAQNIKRKPLLYTLTIH